LVALRVRKRVLWDHLCELILLLLLGKVGVLEGGGREAGDVEGSAGSSGVRDAMSEWVGGGADATGSEAGEE
jgi:hypothetical protein